MNVEIRAIKPSDTNNIVKWRNSKHVLEYFIDRAKITPESHLYYYETKIEKGFVAQFIIVVDGIDVGTVFLRDISLKNRNAEFGIFNGEKDYLGKGIGGKANNLILNYAFNELFLDTVFLRVLKINERAIKSYIKIGFKKIDREEIVKTNDKEEVVIFMEIKKSDFDSK